MGQRANYVVVDNGGWQLYYSHWAATTADRDLFWGPAHTLAFVRAQQDTRSWLDDVWCEGGALIDLERRALLWFGGEDIRFDLPRHRVTLALMRRIWSGWDVHWAFEGLGAFADYLGLPRDQVRSSRRDAPAQGFEHLTVDSEWSSTVVSVRAASGLTLHRVSGDPHELLEFSPELAAALPSRPGHASLHVALQGDGAVTGGAHIDATARTLDLWEVEYHQDLQLDAERWPGWRVEHHGDRFEEHIARSGGALHVEPPSQGLAVEQLTAYLLRTPSFDPRELLASIQKRHQGSEIEVNPLFLTHAPLRLDEEERASILARALAGLPLLPGFAP
jgi:hypothetical protein